MSLLPRQLPLFKTDEFTRKGEGSSQSNKLRSQDRMVHDWYRFVLSYPPHLVRHYLEEFSLKDHHRVLDPFCGTGTTLVEAKLRGVQAVGIEAHPFAHFASTVKIDWNIDPITLQKRSHAIAEEALDILRKQGINDEHLVQTAPQEIELLELKPEAAQLILTNSVSPLPLHKALVLLSVLEKFKSEPFYHHALLAFAKMLVFKISNLHFGPEVGVGKMKTDAPVVTAWLGEIQAMAADLAQLAETSYPTVEAYSGDSRQLAELLQPQSIDAVITSPPYPNEKDYTRTTRLESVILGFVNNKAELRELKKRLIRSNTRGVYKDDDDDQYISQHAEIRRIADNIESRRIELGKNSGFERLYSKVTKLYFGGMARHLEELRGVLRPGAQLAYVVGDQASYLRIMIPTGQLLAQVAETLGYEVVRIDLFRTRFSTVTRSQLREEVVVLRWKG